MHSIQMYLSNVHTIQHRFTIFYYFIINACWTTYTSLSCDMCTRRLSDAVFLPFSPSFSFSREIACIFELSIHSSARRIKYFITKSNQLAKALQAFYANTHEPSKLSMKQRPQPASTTTRKKNQWWHSFYKKRLFSQPCVFFNCWWDFSFIVDADIGECNDLPISFSTKFQYQNCYYFDLLCFCINKI